MLVELDVAIVHRIARLPLVSHRIRIAHIDSSAIAHEALHRLVAHFGLVEAREGRHFDLGLVLGVATQAESRSRRMPYVPEVVAGLLRLHVDARRVPVLRIVQLLVEPGAYYRKLVS